MIFASHDDNLCHETLIPMLWKGVFDSSGAE
jgi:hypothetical protein